jgi:hypothetical protein
LYVEHPIPLYAPIQMPEQGAQPMRLTKAEQKKLRTQRRNQREKERQEMVKQGLLEPPKPKVKISNLMRVLGEQAVMDPTQIEAEVRRQMKERQEAHEDRNLATKLTTEERREKKLKKLFGTMRRRLDALPPFPRNASREPRPRFNSCFGVASNRLTRGVWRFARSQRTTTRLIHWWRCIRSRTCPTSTTGTRWTSTRRRIA